MNDVGKIFAQAQKMQLEMQAAQEALAQTVIEGSAGAGVVKCAIRGSGEILSVEIAPEVIDPTDPEMLGDLVVAALRDAQSKQQKTQEDTFGGLSGDLDMDALGGLFG